MPAVDWSFLQEITLWQLALVVVALWLVGKGLLNLWPALKTVIRLIDALAALPAFMQRTEKQVGEIHHEVHFNNGSSVKDAIVRVENGVRGLYGRMDESDQKLDEHIDFSIAWKARLNEIEERTQPPRGHPNGQDDHS